MKNKIKILGVLFTFVLVVSGCGKSDNKLVCTLDNAKGVVISNYIINYDSDWEEIKSLEVEEVIDFSKAKDISSVGCGDSIDACMENAKADFEVCKNNSMFSNCKMTNETKFGFTITALVDNNELKKVDNIFNVTVNTSKDDAIKILQDGGFECK